MLEEKWEYFRRRINERGIYRVSGPDDLMLPKDPRANPYKWQFYLSAVTTDPEFLDFVSDFFVENFREILNNFTVQLAAPESSGISTAAAISQKCLALGYSVKFLVVRKEHRKYGLFNSIEGDVSESVPTIIVDDLISQNHATFNRTLRVLNDHKFRVANWAFCVVNKRWRPNLSPIEIDMGLEKRYYNLIAPYCLSDFDLADGSYTGPRRDWGVMDQRTRH